MLRLGGRRPRLAGLAIAAALVRPFAAASGTSLYDLSAKSLDGKDDVPLSRFNGQVSLVVNVASE